MNRIKKVIISALLLYANVLIADEKALLDCVIEPSMLVELSSQVRGVLENVYVERGDFVKKGQLVA
ncbi:MAG: biotin/lipoyl-binding protein, partial [Methylococcales bacterium]|nr:biotin/lipoyl-binding protein [Methylococcales bacterium]